MQTFTNVECHNYPETTMFPQETALIQELMQSILQKVAPGITRGTFILDGQKFGEEAKCILRFNLSQGCCHYYFGHNHSETSDQRAENSIDEMLAAYTGESLYIKYNKDEHQICHKITNGQHSMINGVYRYDEDDLIVLVLNATHGRFFITCHLQEIRSDYFISTGELVLYAVAEAIAKMGKEDIALQASNRFICDFGKVPIDQYAEIKQYIDDTFSTGDGPAITAWKAWHEPANSNGELGLFFE